MSQDYRSDIPPICDYEGSDYQTSFWDEGDRAYEDRVESVALRRLIPAGGNLLLEVGAGAGRNTPRYKDFSKIVLLDYSETQLQQAQKRLGVGKRYLFVAADVYRLPFVSGLFDAATMIRVIHHLTEAPCALKQVHRVLRGGSSFILEYANKRNLKAILRFLTGQQNWTPFSREPYEFATLNFNFHPSAVRNWLRDTGFEIERQLTVSHFRIGFLKRWIPLGILVTMDSLIQFTGQWWQLTPSVFLQARTTGTSDAPDPHGFFQCPHCGTPLFEISDPFQMIEAGLEDQVFSCGQCATRWAVKGGVFNFKEPANR